MRWSASCPNREERPWLGMRTLPRIPFRVVFDPRPGAGIVPRWGLLGDHGGMDVLSSRVLLHPTDPERSRVFYRDTLGLAIYREFGSGPERGTVFFLGGGFLELSGRGAASPAPAMALWLQVRELAAVRRELGERGVAGLGGGVCGGVRVAPPRRRPRPWRCGCRCVSWPRCDGSSASVACRSCGSRGGSRGGYWRCGSATRTGGGAASGGGRGGI